MTSDDAADPLQLTFRSGRSDDWPRVAAITSETWEDGDYITAALWDYWVNASEGQLLVAELDDSLAGFCRLAAFGPAEWWLEGIRVDPALRGQGIARALTARLVEWFRRHGDGILRLSTYSENTVSQRLATHFGFHHILSFTEVEAKAWPGDFRSFRLMQPSNSDVIQHYLRRSPVHRINHFVELYWKLYFLTAERLDSYLADDDPQVLGWRQFDQLHGLAIVFSKPPAGHDPETNLLYVGYLDAPDDTTLHSMLRALRGLATKRGLGGVTWKMPTGLGLDKAVAEAGYKPVWDGGELWLYELPLRQIISSEQ